MRIRLDEMTYDRARSFREIILPVGSTEQHGRHLPLGTDSIIADRVCRELARRKGTALCPVLPFGFSKEHAGFPGTIDLGAEAFMAVVRGIVTSLERTYERVYVVNFHGGNSSALETVTKDMSSPKVRLIHFWRVAKDQMLRMTDQKDLGMEHAGEFETSIMLAAFPELVDHEADRGPPESISIEGDKTCQRAWRAEEITGDGSFGGGRWASAEKGNAFLESVISKLAEIVDGIRDEPARDSR